MKTSFHIAKKYFLTKKKTSSANFINVTAVLGVVIGTMALFIILSTFSGLQNLTINLLFEKKSTLKIVPENGKVLTVSPELLKKIYSLNNIKTISSLIEDKVQLMYQGRGDFTYLKGVDSTYINTNLDSLKLYGDLPIYNNEIALSNEIVSKLNITIDDSNDSIKLYVPKIGKIQVNNPKNSFKTHNVVMTGVFNADNSISYCTISLARDLLDLNSNEVYALEIEHDNLLTDEELKAKLKRKIGNKYTILTQKDQLGSFYKMLNTEHIMVYLIFTLILIISTFNLIGSIIILIIEKREDLITLNAVGMNFKDIKRIFLIEGFLVSFIGGVVGVLLGVLLVILQQKFGLIRVNMALPYPAELTVLNFLIVFLTVFVIGVFASILGTVKLTKSFLKK